jgi:hypothetical protein
LADESSLKSGVKRLPFNSSFNALLNLEGVIKLFSTFLIISVVLFILFYSIVLRRNKFLIFLIIELLYMDVISSELSII